MDNTTVLYFISGTLILIGLLGTVLPVLPGLPLMFGGMLLAAWAGGFQHIGAWTLAVMALLVLLSIAVDVGASIVGAKRVGASNKALVGAGLGGVIGIFFGIPGLLAGPFLGAAAGEMVHGREWRAASKVGMGTWLGLALGAVLKVGLAFSMLAIFCLALWLD